MEFILTLISRLPFKVLYVISDMVYVLVYYLIGYRKNIVRKNLTASFPEKNEKELREIERKFYHWLCDYFVETLKLLTITPEEMKKHLEFRGLEKLVEVKKDGQGVSAFLGHYCNWEWLSAAKLYWPWQDAEMGLIYHPLRNEKFDRLMLNMRSSLGGVCIPKQHILRELVALRRKGQDYQLDISSTRVLSGIVFTSGLISSIRRLLSSLVPSVLPRKSMTLWYLLVWSAQSVANT